MKKSNLHWFLFVLFVASILNGYSTSAQYPTRSEISPKFSLDVSCFKGSQGHTQLEIYYSVPSNELAFTNTSDNNNIASISISLTVTNSDNEIVLNNSKNKKLRVHSIEETKDVKIGLIDQMVIDRSTLAKANKNRDWRIYHEFAMVLIKTAKDLYKNENLFEELDETVYALDSSTIDLCLTLFPWAKYKKTKSAIKLHTLLDLQNNIPSFIYITDGSVHDVNILDRSFSY